MDQLSGWKQKKTWLLSPSYFGWPANRPRMYTVMILSEHGRLGGSGLDIMKQLYRIPQTSCLSLLVAPKAGEFGVRSVAFCFFDTMVLWYNGNLNLFVTYKSSPSLEEHVDAHRQELVNKLRRARTSTFDSLLTGGLDKLGL